LKLIFERATTPAHRATGQMSFSLRGRDSDAWQESIMSCPPDQSVKISSHSPVPTDYTPSMLNHRRVKRAPGWSPQPPAGFRPPGRNLPPRRPGGLLIGAPCSPLCGFAGIRRLCFLGAKPPGPLPAGLRPPDPPRPSLPRSLGPPHSPGDLRSPGPSGPPSPSDPTHWPGTSELGHGLKPPQHTAPAGRTRAGTPRVRHRRPGNGLTSR
jgi:hypothetical protein